MRRMTPAEIEAAARSDPDARPFSAAELARMRHTPRAKLIRRALGLTQEEFAARFQIPLGTLRDWEQGAAEPDHAARAYLKVIACDPEAVRRALDPPKNKTKTIPWDSAAYLKTDEDIVTYLEAVFEDGDLAPITRALGVVARAKGMSQIAQAAGLGRESLHEALSEFAAVLKVMRALGLRLKVAL
jgi:putative transcriptional regulator